MPSSARMRREALPSSHPSTSLTSSISLPAETLCNIISHADRSALPALARTSKLLNTLCQSRIWSHLDLSFVIEFDITDAAYRAGSREYWDDLGRRRTAGLPAKIAAILAASNAYRLSCVRSVRLVWTSASLEGAISLLGSVAPNIEVFRLFSPMAGYDEPSEGLRGHAWSQGLDTIDTVLLQQYQGISGPCVDPPSFPNLTTVLIGRHSVSYFDFIPMLCRWAPNITSLSCALDHSRHASKPLDLQCGFFAENSPSTSLRRLSIEFEAIHQRNYDPSVVLRRVANFIRFSPHLERLCIRYERGRHLRDTASSIMEGLRGLTNLSDLRWCGENMGVQGQDAVESLQLDCVPRLVVDNLSWGFPDRGFLMQSVNLHTIHFDCSHRIVMHIPMQFSERSRDALPIAPHFASWLRRNPRLSRISHFCDRQYYSDTYALVNPLCYSLEASRMTGVVSSYTHRGSELLHMKLLLQDIDIVYGDDEEVSRRTIVYVHNLLLNPQPQMFPPEWQEYSEYNGRAVPLQVIDRMREVDGKSKKEWNVRGLEVGEEAWGVLTRWYGEER